MRGTKSKWRRWKSEVKLALINEIKENGYGVETCINMVLLPECSTAEIVYSIHDVEGLRTKIKHLDPTVRKLKNEN